jgi:hypothetical protein
MEVLSILSLFNVIMQVLSIFLLQGGFKGKSTPLTMFSTTLDLILFGFLGLCLHCAFFCLICFMFQSCLFLCKKVFKTLDLCIVFLATYK